MEKMISLFGMQLPVKAGPSSPWPHKAAETGGNGPAQYRYDESNRLTQVVYSGGSSQVFAYDRYGNLSQRKTEQGRSLSYGYDERHRLRSITGDQGERAIYDYGPRTARYASSACTTEIDFDGTKRPVRVRQIIDGVTFRTDYDYDAAGRCIGIRPPGSIQWLLYDHDEKNQTLHIRAEHGQSYATLSPGEVLFANGASQRHRRDSEGRIEQIVATAPGGRCVMDLCYRFDERWLIAQINEQRFSYDAEGRLTECFDGSRDHARYTHDTHGNRLTEQSGHGATSYLYDERDRLLQVTHPDGSRIDYRYDADGNRIAREDSGHQSDSSGWNWFSMHGTSITGCPLSACTNGTASSSSIKTILRLKETPEPTPVMSTRPS